MPTTVYAGSGAALTTESTTAVVGLPSGAAVGDLLLLHVQAWNSRQNLQPTGFTVPSGWTLLGKSDPVWLSNNVTAVQIFTYWKIATSSDIITGPSLTYTGSTVSDHFWAAVLDRYISPNGFTGTYVKLTLPTPPMVAVPNLTDPQPVPDATIPCIAVYHAIGRGTAVISAGTPNTSIGSTQLGATGGQLRGTVRRVAPTSLPPAALFSTSRRDGTSIVFALRLGPPPPTYRPRRGHGLRR